MVDSEGFYVHSCRFYRGTPNELREVGREFIHAYDHSRIVAFGRNEGDGRSGVSTYSIITRCRIDGLRNLFMKNLDDFGAFSVKYPGIFLTDESDGFSVDSDSLHVRVISTRGLPPDTELDRISVHIQDIRQYMGPEPCCTSTSPMLIPNRHTWSASSPPSTRYARSSGTEAEPYRRSSHPSLRTAL